MTIDDVAQRIEQVGPNRVLYGLGGDDARALFEDVGEEGLRAAVLEDGVGEMVRFLAAEVLFNHDPGWVREDDKAEVAAVYVAALRSHIGSTNVWGIPGSIGPAGVHLLGLGDTARRALEPLLDDDTPAPYSGSREVQYGRDAGWRTKDVAATLLAPDRAGELAEMKPAARDKVANELRRGS
jgi:hypothetical protein